MVLGNFIQRATLTYLSLIALAIIVVPNFLPRSLKLSLLLIIVGALYHSYLLPQIDGPLPSYEDTILAVVIADPRFPKPGLISLDLEIFKSQNLGNSFSKGLNRSFKSRCSAIYLPWRNSMEISKGSAFLAKGRFSLIIDSGFFSYERALLSLGFVSSCKLKVISKPILLEKAGFRDRARSSLINTVSQILGKGESSGLVLGMAFGFNDLLSRETEEAFKRVGLAHLLVVSGTQVSLVFVSTAFIFSKVLSIFPLNLLLKLPRATDIFIGGVCAALYLFFVGAEGAPLRAALSTLVLILIIFLGRRVNIFSSLSTVILLMLIFEPSNLTGPSGQLTFAALFGLSLGSLRKDRSIICSYLHSTILASLLTGVVTLLWFNTFSIFGLILNPLFAPLISLISTHGTLFALILYLLSLDPFGLCLKGIAYILKQIKFSLWDLACYEWSSIKIEDPLCKSLLILILLIPIITTSFRNLRSSFGKSYILRIY